jgi:hypothetical protein
MKLSKTQVRNVVDQLASQVIPSNHPSIPQLERSFGEHTFFLGEDGLHVIERSELDARRADHAYAVRLASWDSTKTKLMPHPGTVARAVNIGAESADLGNSDAGDPFESTLSTDD